MIIGQLRMRARQTKNAPLPDRNKTVILRFPESTILKLVYYAIKLICFVWKVETANLSSSLKKRTVFLCILVCA